MLQALQVWQSYERWLPGNITLKYLQLKNIIVSNVVKRKLQLRYEWGWFYSCWWSWYPDSANNPVCQAFPPTAHTPQEYVQRAKDFLYWKKFDKALDDYTQAAQRYEEELKHAPVAIRKELSSTIANVYWERGQLACYLGNPPEIEILQRRAKEKGYQRIKVESYQRAIQLAQQGENAPMMVSIYRKELAENKECVIPPL